MFFHVYKKESNMVIFIIWVLKPMKTNNHLSLPIIYIEGD